MEVLGLLARAALVFGLLAATLWAVRRTDGMRKLRPAGSPMEVLSSARLGKGASVALVRIGDTGYTLGVTDAAVSLIAQTPLPAEPEPAADDDGEDATSARPTFAAALQEQVTLLVRRGAGVRSPRPDPALALAAVEAAAPEPAPAPNPTPALVAAPAVAPRGDRPGTGRRRPLRSMAADGSVAELSPVSGESASRDASSSLALEAACPRSRHPRSGPSARSVALL